MDVIDILYKMIPLPDLPLEAILLRCKHLLQVAMVSILPLLLLIKFSFGSLFKLTLTVTSCYDTMLFLVYFFVFLSTKFLIS